MGWLGDSQNIKDAGFAVTLPTVVKKTGFWFPSLRKSRFAVQRPLPVDAAIQCIGELPNLGLVLSAAGKIGSRGEHSGEEQSRIDQRQLALPDPFAGLHLKEVIIQTLVTGRRLRRLALRAVGEKTERGESSLGGIIARYPAALYRYGIRGQSESDDCDAAGRPGKRSVSDQSIGWIVMTEKIGERRTLQPIDQVVVRQGVEVRFMLLHGARSLLVLRHAADVGLDGLKGL